MDVENKYGTLAIQMELLKLLKAFDAFCQQFGVKYTLSGGSLLGAVRHKGFIPWDDDIDCIVDRNNFNKLCDVIKDNKTLQFERWTKDTLWIGRVRLRQFDYQGSYLLSG